MSTDGGFTLGGLVGFANLRLSFADDAVGDAVLSRPVANAEVLEVGSALHFTGPHEVLLTSGHGLEQQSSQEEIVDALVAAEGAALGLRLGPVWERPPALLVQYCTAKGLPLVLIPSRTSLSQVVSVVHRETEGVNPAFANRLLAAQHSMLEALNDEDPVLALLTRASRTVQGAIAIVAHDGRVESSFGAIPIQLLWQQVGDDVAPMIELRNEGWNGLAVRIGDHGAAPSRWLILASRRASFSDAYVRAVARIVASLVSAVGRIDDLSLAQGRAVRSAVLGEALRLADGASIEALASRAAALGVDFASTARIVVIVAGDQSGSDRTALDKSLPGAEARMSERGLSYLVTTTDNGVVILAQGPTRTLKTFLAEFLARHPGAFIGIGRPVAEISGVPTSYRDATLAAQHLRRSELDEHQMSYEDFDFSMLVLAHAGLDHILPSAQSFLAPISAQPLLMEALEAYFEHNFDIMKAAGAMHLHHNTLRYRISRIERALGLTLRTPAAVTSLYLAASVIAVDREARQRPPTAPVGRIEQTAPDVAGGIENAAAIDPGRENARTFGAAHPFDR